MLVQLLIAIVMTTIVLGLFTLLYEKLVLPHQQEDKINLDEESD